MPDTSLLGVTTAKPVLGSVLRSCPFCAGELAASSWGATGRYRIDVCNRCGAGTTMPPPTQNELDTCYAASYDYCAHALIEAEKRYRSAELIRRAGVTRGRVLDIGCMFGFLLDEARRVGLETWGVEIAHEPAAAAAERGHRMTRGTLDDQVSTHPEVRFDAIFLQHVLEHVPDPASLIATAVRLLAHGGRLVVAVPNFAARLRRLAPFAWGWYRTPLHLHHFTPTALRHLLTAAGLVVDAEHTFGGDSLFFALTALRATGLDRSGARRFRPSGPVRLAFGALGGVLRPYYKFGDDELVLVARSG